MSTPCKHLWHTRSNATGELTKHSWVFPHKGPTTHLPDATDPSPTLQPWLTQQPISKSSWKIHAGYSPFIYMNETRRMHRFPPCAFLSRCRIWEFGSVIPGLRAYRHTQTVWVFWDAGSPRTDPRRPSRSAHQTNGETWRSGRLGGGWDSYGGRVTLSKLGPTIPRASV